MKLKSLTDTFIITKYSPRWRSWRVWQTRSWSPIPPPLNKLKSLADTFLITSTLSIEEVVQFERHVLDHQSSLHWRNWRVWQTRSSSPILPPLKNWRVWQIRSWSQILPPLKKLKNLIDTFLITNTPSIEGAEEFDRHVLDSQYYLHWRSWRIWKTRSW